MSNRATGKTSELSYKKESVYGLQESAPFLRMPYISTNLGTEKPLEQQNILSNGAGRDPSDPDEGVIDGRGTLVVPVDLRYFGHHLQQLFGDAVTSDAKSNGHIKFLKNPAEDDTITINGVVFTFKAAGPVGNQIEIKADLKATLDEMVTVLNASVDTDVDDATYSENGRDKLIIEHDVAGATGDTFTLAASAGQVSGATLTGGTNKRHVFSSGAATLPSAQFQTAHPRVSKYKLHTGVKYNAMAINLERGGALTASIELISQNEIIFDTTQAGTLGTLVFKKLTQKKGELLIDDEIAGNISAANFNFSNQGEVIENVGRGDGLIDDVEPGETLPNGGMSVRFANDTKHLIDKAVTTPPTPIKLQFQWEINPGEKLIWTFPRTFVPKPKDSIDGPGGIIHSLEFQSSYDSVNVAPAVTVELINDVTAYN